jgi:serine/threonine protein kinase
MSLVLSIASDVCEGMIYLHSRGIIHADLKASNVLLKTVVSNGVERVVAKVSDFGTSVILTEGQKEVHDFFAGTPTHMSPETIEFSVISKVHPPLPFSLRPPFLLAHPSTCTRTHPFLLLITARTCALSPLVDV